MDNLIKEYKGKIPRALLMEFKKEAEEARLTLKQAKSGLEKLKEEYKKAKISPGEAIGIITAESFGEPGTQMSIQKNEKIIVRIKNKIKIIEIGKFVDALMNSKGSFRLNNDSEILPVNDLELSVPSLNQDEKIEWKKIVECSRHKTRKKLLKLKTSSGREITATDNHSFVTRINNSIVPVVGNQLKVGDRMPVMNSLIADIILSEVRADEEIQLNSYVDSNGMLQVNGTNTKPMQNLMPLDHVTGWFIGAYLAEGYGSQYAVDISNVDDNYINNTKRFIERIRLDYKEDFHHRGFAESRDLKVNSSLLGKFITKNCGQGSDFKKVPEFAYSASDEFVSGLLRGYFDGDGNFHVDRKMIKASSNSKELVNGIALLLSRFKIFSFKIKDKKGQHWLLIPYKYAPLYLAHIGSDIEYKKKDLEKLAEMAKKFWNDKSQDYTDMISGFGDLFYSVAKKLGYPTRYVNNFTKRQKIGRTALFRYIKIFEGIAEEKGIDIKNELEIMKKMFYSDVIWDEIINIESVDVGDEYVYDLSVPGLETFTTAEGIITHNTLNVFHFAGAAEVSVTQGLPRLIELFDARVKIKTPSMEVYLKKEYSKDVDKVRKVAAAIKETKLFELISEFSINVVKLQVELLMNKKRMRDFGITPAHIEKVIVDKIKDVGVKIDNDAIILKTKAKGNELMETYKLKEAVKLLFIKGVEGIKQVLPVKVSGGEFIIWTAGSNLKGVFDIKEVDVERTTTNDIYEVARVLGIEAARQTIMIEAKKVIQDQGLEVDVRHTLLMADIMTTSGEIRGITRSGITGEKESVLAKASFETPIKHLVNASMVGEVDYLNSVVENVMLNQAVPLGTGLPDLVAKMDSDKMNGKSVKK